MDNPAAPIPSISPQPAAPSLPADSSSVATSAKEAALAKAGPAETSSPRWFLWSAFGLIFLVLGVAVGLFSAKFLIQPQRLSQLSPTPSPKLPSQSPTPTPTPDPTANWKTYTNTVLGFSFKYPPELEIQENISGPSEVSSGSKFNLTFKNALQDFQMGGITSDFGEGRGGMFTDTQGFLKIDNKLYCLFVGEIKFEIPNNLLKKIYSNNNVEIVLMNGYTDPSNMSGELSCNNPGSGYIGALVNLKGDKFKGLGILFQRDSSTITEQQFDQILSTFKFSD